MNDVSDYLPPIREIKVFSTYKLFITEEGTYYYISKEADEDIYLQLKESGFSLYYPLMNSYEDHFQLFRLEKGDLSPLFILKDLYSKTEKNISFPASMKQQIYQKLQKRKREGMSYYLGIQDRIEEMYYPRNMYYHLLLSISNIYRLFSIGEYFLNRFLAVDPSSYREVLCLRNLSDSNFMGGKIIDFSSSKRDYYVFELANYYQKYSSHVSLLELSSFFLVPEDEYLFYALISIVPFLEEEDAIFSLLSYVQKTYSYLLEKQKEDQEREESMLQKE